MVEISGNYSTPNPEGVIKSKVNNTGEIMKIFEPKSLEELLMEKDIKDAGLKPSNVTETQKVMAELKNTKAGNILLSDPVYKYQLEHGLSTEVSAASWNRILQHYGFSEMQKNPVKVSIGWENALGSITKYVGMAGDENVQVSKIEYEDYKPEFGLLKKMPMEHIKEIKNYLGTSLSTHGEMIFKNTDKLEKLKELAGNVECLTNELEAAQIELEQAEQSGDEVDIVTARKEVEDARAKLNLAIKAKELLPKDELNNTEQTEE